MDNLKIKDQNEINIELMINLYLDPIDIYIPIIKEEKFKLNTYIYKNTYFDKYHSSISGKITGSKKVYINKKAYPALKITNDFKENILNKNKRKKVNNKIELISLLEEYHLDKIIKKINNKNIQNLVITSVDDEIYAYNELMILTNYTNKIYDTIDKLLKILDLKIATIAIKNTSFKAIKNVNAIKGTYPNIDIKLLKDYYLVSYDTFICQELNLKLEETLVLSSNDIYNIYNIFKGNIVNETFITISGNAILKSMVIKTRLGTSLEEIINKLIKIKEEKYDIFINGPIKGYLIKNIDNYIITDDIKCIVINKKEDKQVYECINCGACFRVCPYKINVLKHYKENKKSKYCIGCGLCNYVCPSNINLKEKVDGGLHE